MKNSSIFSYPPIAHRLAAIRRPTALTALLALCLAQSLVAQTSQPPVVTGVTATNRAGTSGVNSLVDIGYTISDPNFTSVNVFVLVSKDSGATWTVPALTFTGAYGANVSVTTTPTSKTITWYAGADWGGNYTPKCRVRVLANNVGLVLIPFGSYLRGNPPALGDSDITDAPVYPVYVSAFYIDQNLVSGGLWTLVVQTYANANGYSFVNAGSYKGLAHPIQTIDWYDAVKWCNARSEREGLTPVYYADVGLTAVYKAGEAAPYWKQGANGYRLPTEAEWEKAARGGASGHRFPWSDADTISQNQANYYSSSSYSYDLTGGNGYNPPFVQGAQPYTSPVGSFAPNGYYLYDMAGNVFEWCWDWYSSSYYASAQSDPQGPASGSNRVLRGGCWDCGANVARCANRYDFTPSSAYYNAGGFRCVRGL